MTDDRPIVFVVDDDVSVRDSLALLIESEGWQADTCGSGREFLSRRRTTAPSCLVLDMCLPDLNGLDIQALVVDRTDMPVILISGHGDIPSTVRAMEAGAVTFLTKPVIADELLAAIRRAFDRSCAEQERMAQMCSLRDSYDTLSHREREVLELIVAGRLNKQVGSELGISEITVKAHRGRMMRKMHASSLPDLVRMAAKLNVMPF
jgi:FixJ family two-component response regulator